MCLPCSPHTWQDILKLCNYLGGEEEIPYFLHKTMGHNRTAPQRAMRVCRTQQIPQPLLPPEHCSAQRPWAVLFGTWIGFHNDFPFLWWGLWGTDLIYPQISCYAYFSRKLKYISVKCRFDNKLAYMTFYY